MMYEGEPCEKNWQNALKSEASLIIDNNYQKKYYIIMGERFSKKYHVSKIIQQQDLFVILNLVISAHFKIEGAPKRPISALKLKRYKKKTNEN